MTGQKKQEIITFKVDASLAEELNKVANRSEFIRKALLQALGNECPVCGGTGILTPNQLNHWQDFMHHHSIIKCRTCNEVYVACDAVQGERH